MPKEITLEENGQEIKAVAYGANENVKVKFEYPKDYKKAKHFADGHIEVMHVLTANAIVAKGIAKIVRD